MKPPIAQKKAHKLTAHDDTRVDNYYWLRDREDESVIEYLEKENSYTDFITKGNKENEKALFNEMLGRIKESDLSVPEKDAGYYYYTRTEEGKGYQIHCRKKETLDAVEEILLDENDLAEGHEFFDLHEFEISPNDRFLAYSTDITGSEKYALHIKDLKTGLLVDNVVKETAGDIIWANDNNTFFYNRLDDSMRPYQLWKRQIGSDPKKDKLVFAEEDQRFFLSPSKTKSEKFLLIYLQSKVTTEVHYLDASNPQEPFQLFAERKHNVEYSIAHHQDRFYIMTDDEAINFKLMHCPVGLTDWKHWQATKPYNPEVKLSGLEAFENHLAIYGRKDGLKSIHVLDFKTNNLKQVQFPQPLYSYHVGENPEYYTDTLRFTYSSLKTPRRVIDYNLNNGEFKIKKEYEVLGGFDQNDYHEERILATAEDGTKIPISLIHKKGLKKDGSNPCNLYAYGSYGSSTEASFTSTIFSLIDRGFIYAVAHIRGGSEMGRRWYEDGKFLNKKNTFTDFIACAKHLVETKYSSVDKMVARGGSAGGLLMGAVANLAPQQFKLICAHVPFVDVVTTMLDESIPLTVIEYDEWGNPNEQKFYEYMLSYSPYDNVEKKEYPNLLITAGLNDPRVQYWEPAKWCAKLRDYKTDDNLLIMKTNMGAGHQGQSGRYGYLKERAFEFAFIMQVLNIPLK